MKMRETKTEVIRTEDFEESYFGIDNDDDLIHIFNILRSKIYTDKVMAVIREYSTNAQDAHIDVGTPDRPIDIGLPNKLSPEFSVRDYGPGLSDEAVRTIYVKYGKSTKRNSNDFNGQLGLGCKAGFAYGDSFLITSYRDGVATSFEAYIDETKIGKVAKLQSKETDEPNGVKITIPVKPQDVDAFISTARYFYRHFNPTPNVPGVKIEEVVFTYSGTEWGIEKAVGYNNRMFPRAHRNVVPIAIMGNIAYPVDCNILEKNTPTKPWRKVESLSRVGIVMSFDIGTLGISSSREGLEYDKETVRALVDRMSVVIDELTEEIQKEFDDIEDIFDAKSKYYTFFEDYNTSSIVKQLVPDPKIRWKNQLISSSFFRFNFSDRNTEISGLTLEPDSGKQSGVTQRKITSHWRWRHNANIVYVINDAPDKWILRLRNYLEQHPDKKCAKVFKVASTTEGTECWKKFKEDNLFEDKHFIKLSDWEPLKIKRTVGVRLPKHKAKVFEFNCTITADRSSKSEPWVVSDVDIKKPTGSYLVLDRFCPQVNGDTLSNKQLAKLLHACNSLFGEDLGENLIGVKTALVDKVDKTWPKFEDQIKSKFQEKVMDDDNLLSMLAINELIDAYSHHSEPVLEFIWKEKLWEVVKTDPKTPAGEVFKMLEDLSGFKKNREATIDHVQTISKTLSLIGSLQGKQKSRADKIKTSFKYFENKYPMIVSSLTYHKPKVKDVEDYISLVNRS